MTHATTGTTTPAFLRTTTVAIAIAIGIAFAGLAALVALQRSPADAAAPDLRASLIAREALRLEAARASLDAKPLLGASHLPPYDARAAIAREESALRQLSSTGTATR